MRSQTPSFWRWGTERRRAHAVIKANLNIDVRKDFRTVKLGVKPAPASLTVQRSSTGAASKEAVCRLRLPFKPFSAALPATPASGSDDQTASARAGADGEFCMPAPVAHPRSSSYPPESTVASNRGGTIGLHWLLSANVL